PVDIAFACGNITGIGKEVDGAQAAETRRVDGCFVVPGLIDLHTHVYWGGTSLGVDAEIVARASGTTTFIDAGSAGPGNYEGFLHHVIKRSKPRILAFLNLSFAGIFGFSRSVMVGECADVRLLDLKETIRVARENPATIVGIKVRVGRLAGGTSGMTPLEMAIEAAEELGLPIMTHIDLPPPSLREILNRLRPGDILTHCFRPFPNAPLVRGRIREEALLARERGVIFDIGHGMGSLCFATAEAMMEQGFFPDVISSDVHALSIEGPAYDLLVTLSKFLAMGLPLRDIVERATVGPARAVRRPELGVLHIGGLGDATVLAIEKGKYFYIDATGEKMISDQRLVCKGCVVAGTFMPVEQRETGDESPPEKETVA
ncbi:MAG: amidohydrolase/deacetylase family metallohydrolase, partial [Verrucomicrobia bacterium]|nr:amidohydrolase/deacetylase family metallohydrolase [Verrucomicrobiota bacterium]